MTTPDMAPQGLGAAVPGLLLPGLHQRDRVQPDRHPADVPLGEVRDGARVGDRAGHGRAGDRQGGQRAAGTATGAAHSGVCARPPPGYEHRTGSHPPEESHARHCRRDRLRHLVSARLVQRQSGRAAPVQLLHHDDARPAAPLPLSGRRRQRPAQRHAAAAVAASTAVARAAADPPPAVPARSSRISGTRERAGTVVADGNWTDSSRWLAGRGAGRWPGAPSAFTTPARRLAAAGADAPGQPRRAGRSGTSARARARRCGSW